jgi:hypothetical protein
MHCVAWIGIGGDVSIGFSSSDQGTECLGKDFCKGKIDHRKALKHCSAMSSEFYLILRLKKIGHSRDQSRSR